MKIFLVLITTFFANPCFAESFSCVGEKTIGLEAKKDYKQVTFESYKWIIKPGADPYAYQVFLFNKDEPRMNCYTKEQRSKEVVNCRSNNAMLQFSKNSMRYVYMNAGTYVLENANEDIITELGACTKI